MYEPVHMDVYTVLLVLGAIALVAALVWYFVTAKEVRVELPLGTALVAMH